MCKFRIFLRFRIHKGQQKAWQHGRCKVGICCYAFCGSAQVFVVLPTRVGTKRSRAPLWPWRLATMQPQHTATVDAAHRAVRMQSGPPAEHPAVSPPRHRAAKIATFRNKISKDHQRSPISKYAEVATEQFLQSLSSLSSSVYRKNMRE
jgi:hypothetical protein